MTKRKLQALESRKHILDTALELTKKNGFERTSIQDICREAGVSTGAFYHYFKSKDEILIVFRGTVLNWCRSKGAYSLSDNALRLVARYMAAFMEKDCSAGNALAFANVRLKEG